MLILHPNPHIFADRTVIDLVVIDPISAGALLLGRPEGTILVNILPELIPRI